MRLGPGAMVAAAFIGPGTVTTAAAAGAQSGISLLWAVVFSVLATVVLQELALRSALVTNRDLATLMRQLGDGRWWGPLLILLIVAAVGVGNAAYQSGNLSGAGIGLQAALGLPARGVMGLAAGFAALLILIDRYLWLERILIVLVAVMATVFCGLAVLLVPSLVDQPGVRLWPGFRSEDLTLVLALIGTTVVPYNLFLHATAVRRRWAGTELSVALAEARSESRVSIAIGGLTTVAVIVVAAALVTAGGDEPALEATITAIESRFPGWGSRLVGFGLFAAGLTSAIAAPVVAGWAVCGAMGWSHEPGSRAFKGVAMAVLVVGTVLALSATRPTVLIVSAQATNALLLPIVAIALLAVANSSRHLGSHRNRGIDNIVSVVVILLVVALAARKLLAFF